MNDPRAARTPLDTEWLLTDGLGGFAMGTATGTLTRRYHGLLVAALHPPVDRVVLVSQVVEKLVVDGQEHWLSPMRFVEGEMSETNVQFECAFLEDRQRIIWRFERDGVRIEKVLERSAGHAAALLTYRIQAERPGSLELRPLLALRDFHDLRTAGSDPVNIEYREDEVAARSGSMSVHIGSSAQDRVDEFEVWSSLLYTLERDRGQDCAEDLIVPCRFVSAFGVGTTTVEVRLSDQPAQQAFVCSTGLPGLESTLKRVPEGDRPAREAVARLVAAADQFVVRRGGAKADQGVSIIAGYPWFSDWGRDTMISLPGLLLETGRFAEAFATLRVFGSALRRGLIPNRFDDYAGGAHYNTVDASLWFLHAATAYRETADDHAGFIADLKQPCLDIIEAYQHGTDYDICMEEDGLITAGSPETQLTWMDAQRDGVTFTPRFGKCVEINALWHHGLVRVARAIEGDDADRASTLNALAERAQRSFRSQFFNPQGGLFDRLEPRDGTWVPVDEIRPNQVFAASLLESPADPGMKRSVLEVTREHLLTPVGLRTLAPTDPAYIGSYIGTLFERDRAYHNGTVWPWLFGAYAEGVWRTAESQASARAHLRPILASMTGRLDAWCVGQLSEVCDGDAPHRPDGCPAQAWSVAELLRAWLMVTGTPLN